jgi:long-chain fatty acid transport protein
MDFQKKGVYNGSHIQSLEIRTMTKKILIAAMAALFLLPSFAPGNGLNLNGLGSRAQGMGGAFVGIANDFSAVFWNPAGAAGLSQTTFGFYATDLIPRATYRSLSEITIPEIEPVAARTKDSHYLGFLAGYYRPVSSKVVIGLGIGTPSEQGTLWNGADFAGLSGGTTYDWSSRLVVFSFSPLVAVKLSDAISVGVALNVNLGTSSLKMPAGPSTLPGVLDVFPPVDLGQYEESMTGWGLGATFGVLVRPIDKLSIGLTVRTPLTIAFDGSARMSNLSLHDLPGSSELERTITWPLWVGGGLAFRPVPRLLLSADVHWTQWSKLGGIRTTFTDPAWRTFTAAEGRGIRVLDWEDATQIRFGAEYTLNGTTALRAGYYNDPAPGPASTLNVLLPTHTFNAFSVGVGKTVGDLQLDFGLAYLRGNARSAELGLPNAMPGTYTMSIVVPTASVSFKF